MALEGIKIDRNEKSVDIQTEKRVWNRNNTLFFLNGETKPLVRPLRVLNNDIRSMSIKH